MSKFNRFLNCPPWLFPACASFGPLFIAIGFLSAPSQHPLGAIQAMVGALMTSAAILFLHRKLVEIEARVQKLKPDTDLSL